MNRREWIKGIAAGAALMASGGALMSCRRHSPDLTTRNPAAPLQPNVDDEVIAALPGEIDCYECGRCMPCPFGVDIPGNFALYNESLDEGLIPQSAGDLLYESGKRGAIAYVDRAVATLGDKAMAHRCVGCRACVDYCPADLPIDEYLKSIGRLVWLAREKECQR